MCSVGSGATARSIRSAVTWFWRPKNRRTSVAAGAPAGGDRRQAPRAVPTSAVELMKILARACGYTHLSQFRLHDLVIWKRDVAYLTGVRYGGVVPL